MRDFVNQFIMKQWICGTWRKQKCRRNLLFAFGKGDTNETDVRRQQYQEDGYEEQIKKIAVIGLSACLALGTLSGCSKKETFQADAAAITVNGDEISAGLVKFATHYSQALMESMYKMYMGVEDPMDSDIYGNGSTLGAMIKDDVVSTLERLVLAEQKMSDYNVELTDDEKAAVTEAATRFMDENGEEVLNQMGATQEVVERYLTLRLIQSKMEPQMSADVDTEVSDEEAKQTSISYITVSTAGTEKDDDGKTIDLTDEEKAAKKEIAQRFLDLLKESEDPAAASFTDLRKELNDQLNAENTADSTDSADSSDESSSSSDASDTSASDASSASTSSSSASDSSSEVSYLTSSETSFGTGSEKDDDDTCSLGDKVAEEAAKLKDGEYYDGVIEGDDAYYVIRVDKAFGRGQNRVQKTDYHFQPQIG